MLYVVDDAADYRFIVQQVFNRFLPGYPLRLFADGLDLVESIEWPADLALTDLPEPERVRSGQSTPGESTLDQSRPDLIVLDVDMPKLNGFQTLERLKQHPVWQSIPVVMMSSRVSAEFSETAHQLGAHSYILKPMGLTELQQIMTQLCHQWLD